MAGRLEQRIQSFDWLRGVAVVFMVQTHTVMFLLEPSLKSSTLYRVLMRFDGLVAPSFIFAAGFSLALVQVRGAGKPGRVRKTLRRIGEVLAVATFVNWCWFPVVREPKWLLRIDILHCIGLSLLLALPVLVALASRPRVLRWVMLGLAVAAFAVTPLARDVTGWPSLFLNQSSGALFPLLPWAGYVLLGASAGATAALGSLRELVVWIVFLCVAGFAVWMGLSLDHPQRVFWVMSFVLALLFIEQRWADARVLKAVTVLGTSSLAAYCMHELMLFYGAWWVLVIALLIAWQAQPVRGAVTALAAAPLFAYESIGRVRGLAMAHFFRDQAGWALYWVLFAVLLVATYGIVVVIDALYRRLDAALARATP